MQTIEFKGKKWTIDLDWEILPGDSSVKEESKDVAIKTNCNYGILVDYDGVFAIGLAKKNTKIPSASLLLALANQEVRTESGELDNYPDWIVVEEMGDDKYWMAVINRGIPSPQYDKIFDITTVKDKINELLLNDTYHLYSPCGEIKSIFEGMKYVEDKTLNDLTENITTKIKFTKLRGLPNSVVYVGIGFLVVCGIGLGASTFLDSYTMKQRAQEALHRQEEEAAQAKAAYDAKMNIYNQQINTMKQKAQESVVLGLSGVPSKVLNAWYESVGNLDNGTHGWKMDKIDCEFIPDMTNNKSMCTINFIRTGLSTNRMLLQDYPDAILQGDKATVTRKVLVDDNIFAKPDNSVLNTLPTAKDWGFDMISQLQLLKIAGVNFEIKPSVEITVVPPVKPIGPNEVNAGGKPAVIAPISIGIAMGEVTVKSDNFDLLRELADNVDFKAVGVKKISFRLGELGSIVWETTLSYYLNTNNGVIAGSNSETLSDNVMAKNKTDNGKPIGQTMGNPPPSN